MKNFLEECADEVMIGLANWPEKEHLVLVPNNRTATYLKKYLLLRFAEAAAQNGNEIESDAVRVLTFKMLAEEKLGMRVASEEELAVAMYPIYEKVLRPTDFGSYLGTAKTLLADFDLMDGERVEMAEIFKALQQREALDGSFSDYLDEEQQAIIFKFWEKRGAGSPEGEEDDLWTKLPKLYAELKEKLIAQGMGYTGLLLRLLGDALAESSEKGKSDLGVLHVVGFSAMGKGQLYVMGLLARKAELHTHLDTDSYYIEPLAVTGIEHEVGDGLRELRRNKLLYPQGAPDVEIRIESGGKVVNLTEVASGQGMLNELNEILKGITEAELKEDTLVVLPEAGLALPLIQSVVLPAGVDMNLTLGILLGNAALLQLLKAVNILLRKRQRGAERIAERSAERNVAEKGDRKWTWPEVEPLLSSTWVGWNAELRQSQAEAAKNGIALLNKVAEGLLFAKMPWLQGLEAVAMGELGETAWVEAWMDGMLKGEMPIDPFEQMAFEQIQVLLEMLVGIEKEGDGVKESRGSLQLLDTLVRLGGSKRVQLAGMPLDGLQVMGLIETQNLDFKNVIVLGVNEGTLPASPRQNSLIPYAIKKAFRLPTDEETTKASGYYFLRLLQRAENVWMLQNTDLEDMKGGEVSRYVMQLQVETPIEWRKRKVLGTAEPAQVVAITIEKDDLVMQSLGKYVMGNLMGGRQQGLYPSNILEYMSCSLKFYFKKVLGIREDQQLAEGFDAAIFGTVLHDTLEALYKDYRTKHGAKMLEKGDVQAISHRLGATLDTVMKGKLGLEDQSQGLNVGLAKVVREVVMRYATRVLELDAAYAPFEMLHLEYEMPEAMGVPIGVEDGDGEGKEVAVYGKIDRVDRKDGVVRIVDYKTGSVKKDGVELEKVFAEGKQEFKEFLQLSMYAAIYKLNAGTDGAQVMPAVLALKEAMRNDFNYETDVAFRMKSGGIGALMDVADVEKDLMDGLSKVMGTLYDQTIPFAQTSDRRVCEYCDYRQICHR